MKDMKTRPSFLQRQETPANHYAWTKLGFLIYILGAVASFGTAIGFLYLWGLALGN